MAKPRPSKTRIGNHVLRPETLMLSYGYDPMLSLHDGELRATFVPCHDSGDYCDDSGRMVYRQSHDGVHWSKPEYISPKGLYPEPRGIWFAGKPIVLYEANTTRYYVPVLFARTRAT